MNNSSGFFCGAAGSGGCGGTVAELFSATGAAAEETVMTPKSRNTSLFLATRINTEDKGRMSDD